MHSEEELAGSYNWDYLLDWGPQYQPLAHVFQVEYKYIYKQQYPKQFAFQEISSLKDEGSSGAGGEARAPPIITCRWVQINITANVANNNIFLVTITTWY